MVVGLLVLVLGMMIDCMCLLGLMLIVSVVCSIGVGDVWIVVVGGVELILFM